MRTPWNIYDELRSFGIAPSRISASDVVTVACAIFSPTDDEIGDFRTVRKYYIFTKELPPSDTTAAIKDESKKSIEQFEPVLNEALSKTLDVQVSETSTSFILGMFCAKFCTLLTSELSREYKHLPQYTVASNSKAGQNPRADGAVVLVKVINSGASMQSRIPVVLYELKPAVQPTHLMEVMLQGYYCIKYNKLETLLVCLIDTFTWQYFKLTTKSTSCRTISVEGYKIFDTRTTEEDPYTGSLEEHFRFLVDVLK